MSGSWSLQQVKAVGQWMKCVSSSPMVTAPVLLTGPGCSLDPDWAIMSGPAVLGLLDDGCPNPGLARDHQLSH